MTLKPFAGSLQSGCLIPELVTQKLFCPGWNVAVKTGDFDLPNGEGVDSGTLLSWVLAGICRNFFLFNLIEMP